jgi:hypothetical protein
MLELICDIGSHSPQIKMNTKSLRKTVFKTSAMAAITTCASAAAINITVGSGGSHLQDGTGLVSDPALSLASNAFYSSFQNPISTANDKDNNLAFLQGVIGNWNTHNPDLPLVGSAASVPADVGSIGDTSSFAATAGYEYVVFHFGNGQAGYRNIDDETGWWSAWYLGGNSHVFSLPTEGGEPVGGFSSARFFNPIPSVLVLPQSVPDGGTTLALFSISILGLFSLRSKFAKH